MYRLIRPFLFQLDAEFAHGIGVKSGRAGQLAGPFLRSLYKVDDERLEQILWQTGSRAGVRFVNPVGLAAGFDKNAELIPFWPMLGFGFAEIGSVTARPSEGNPRPRAFRLPADHALINRMGLNNDGAEIISGRLSAMVRPNDFTLGVNIAKTHDPQILGDEALADFGQSVEYMLPYADYLTLNVSCPNTAEGKTFEEPEPFDALLSIVMAERERQKSDTPILVKFSPPPSQTDPGNINELIQIACKYRVDGFVATNTAPDRQELRSSKARLKEIGAGGLSGKPLAARATALVRHLFKRTDGSIPIIGVGGIASFGDALERIQAGASLIQVYTGLVYKGPGLIKQINKGLVRHLDKQGLDSVAKLVGTKAS